MLSKRCKDQKVEFASKIEWQYQSAPMYKVIEDENEQKDDLTLKTDSTDPLKSRKSLRNSLRPYAQSISMLESKNGIPQTESIFLNNT